MENSIPILKREIPEGYKVCDNCGKLVRIDSHICSSCGHPTCDD
jgi:rRNA maturation endonuclease Nob1